MEQSNENKSLNEHINSQPKRKLKNNLISRPGKGNGRNMSKNKGSQQRSREFKGASLWSKMNHFFLTSYKFSFILNLYSFYKCFILSSPLQSKDLFLTFVHIGKASVGSLYATVLGKKKKKIITLKLIHSLDWFSSKSLYNSVLKTPILEILILLHRVCASNTLSQSRDNFQKIFIQN